jgi:hypothetical protein
VLGGVWAAGPASAPAVAPKPGDVVFQADFNDPAETKGWSQARFAEWVGEAGHTALRVVVPAEEATRDRMIRRTIDLTPYRGWRLYFECMAKAEGVTQPPHKYNGVKFMLDFNTPATGQHWVNQNNVYGTFDWKKIGFTVSIPDDATTGTLHLGLQESSGTVWFDHVRVTAFSVPEVRPTPPRNPGRVFRGHDLARLRGVMSPSVFREEDLRVLGQNWKANLIRWQIQPSGLAKWKAAGTARDLAAYDQWMDGKLEELDKVLEACRKYGIKAVIDLHEAPGGRDENNNLVLLYDAKYQEHFVALWEKIARRYKGNRAVWGYDLVNEPVQSRPSPEGLGDYLEAQVRAAKAVRAIDPTTPIIFEVDQWDDADAFRYIKPVDIPNVVYEVHMYWPQQFTHQGIEWPEGVSYPGVIAGLQCDKEALRRHLQPVRDFQVAYNVHIYAGEFSAIRWAPGESAANYLRDCIDLFEEYGWDWTYHAYREWDGWSVEHGSDRNDTHPTAQPTSRKQLLLEWFARNPKPPG